MSERKPEQNKGFAEQLNAWYKQVLSWIKRTSNRIRLKTQAGIKTWRGQTWPRIKLRTKRFFDSVSASFKDRKQQSSKEYKEQKKKQELSDLRSRYDRPGTQTNLNFQDLDARKFDPSATTDTSIDEALHRPEHLANYDPLAVEDEFYAAEEARLEAEKEQPKDAKQRLTNAGTFIRDGVRDAGTRVKSWVTRKQQYAKRYKPFQYKGIQSRLMRHGRQKVYRLKGYTTVARVNRKRRREYIKRQRNVLLLSALFIVIVIMLFMWIDPLPKIQALLHDIGFLTNSGN